MLVNVMEGLFGLVIRKLKKLMETINFFSQETFCDVFTVKIPIGNTNFPLSNFCFKKSLRENGGGGGGRELQMKQIIRLVFVIKKIITNLNAEKYEI